MPGPLDGIKVLEFTEIIAGPFAGMLLGDMGADVIKVEPPWGEPWRFAQEFLPNESKTYISLNRNKRSLTLDLTKPQAREVVYKLVLDMDVVIINSRPDVPYNLGIDYETLSSKSPRIIYCENTAFGRRGPHSHRPGYDIIAQAMSGLMTSEGKVLNGVPQQIQSTALADFSTGLAIAWGVSAALFSRERTGKGQKIETTLMASALAIQTSRFLQVAAIDQEPRETFLRELDDLREVGAGYEDMLQLSTRRVIALRVGNIYYRTYMAKDGPIAVGCLSNPLRKRLLSVIGLEDIRFDPDYDPFSEKAKAFAEKLIAQAEEIIRQKTVDEWLKLFDKAGVPAGPVRFVEELIDDEQVTANGMAVDLEHSLAGSMRMVGPMLNMTETPLKPQSASPALGQHSDEILKSLGYGAEDIQQLRDDSVIL